MSDYKIMKEEVITPKQKKYIEDLQEFSEYPLPEFKGTTKQEAAEYINKYGKLAHETVWAINRGY